MATAAFPVFALPEQFRLVPHFYIRGCNIPQGFLTPAQYLRASGLVLEQQIPGKSPIFLCKSDVCPLWASSKEHPAMYKSMCSDSWLLDACKEHPFSMPS